MLLELIPMAIGTMTAIYGIWQYKCANRQYDIKVTDAQGRTVYMRSNELENQIIDGGELRSQPPIFSGYNQITFTGDPVQDLVNTTADFVRAHSNDFKYRDDSSFNNRGHKQPLTSDCIFWEGLDSKHMRITRDKHGVTEGGKKCYIDDLEIPNKGYEKILKVFRDAQATEMKQKIQREAQARIDKMQKAINKKQSIPRNGVGEYGKFCQTLIECNKEASTKSDIVDPFRSNLERSHHHNWFGYCYYGKHISKVEKRNGYGWPYYRIAFQDGSVMRLEPEVFERDFINSRQS